MQLSKTRRRALTWLVSFGFWTALGLFFASQVVLNQLEIAGKQVDWSRSLLMNLPFYWMWGLLAPLVLKLCDRFPLDGERWRRSLPIHLGLGLALALGHLALAEILFWMIRHYRGHPASYFEGLLYSVRMNAHMNFLTYWGILAVKQALDFYHRYRERELAASQLQTQVARAELQALRMQLNPHFLFNTLNSISALVYSDADAAERMITRLSDLLRQTLDNTGRLEVPLSEEIELLERYLDIERIRFRDRLSVTIAVAPELLDVPVPNLLLQPLVENALRHGINRRAAPGHLEVRARQAGAEVWLEVEDDGPGFAAGKADDAGVGLANTRARLAQLHGAAAALEMLPGSAGGVLARVRLPRPPAALEPGPYAAAAPRAGDAATLLVPGHG